jgi:hypothetical protein
MVMERLIGKSLLKESNLSTLWSINLEARPLSSSLPETLKKEISAIIEFYLNPRLMKFFLLITQSSPQKDNLVVLVLVLCSPKDRKVLLDNRLHFQAQSINI